MSDPVGGAGSAPAAGSGGSVESTDSADPTAPVGSGYSAENTQSNSEGDGFGGSGVDMDAPGTGMVRSTDYFKQAFKARLLGFSSVISDFSSRFLTRGGNEIDIETLLSDTQTLLLVFRGFVKDIQSLNKAQTIGLAADAHAAAAGRSLEIPQLKQDIKDFEGSLAGWWVGDEKDPLFFSDTLRDKESSESRLHAVNTLMALVVTAVRDAKVALGSVQVQNNPASLETGEESLLKRRLDNLIELHGARLLGRKQGKSTDELRAFNKDTVEEYDEAIDRAEPGVVAEALRVLLTPALLTRLSGLFALGGASAAIASDNDDSTTDQQLADTIEGLALILLAEPTETGSEENPVDQPYLGDSLSLEGANNPQAFALLLLQEKMSEIQASAKKDYARLAEAKDASGDRPVALAEAKDTAEDKPVALAEAKGAAEENPVALAEAEDGAEDTLLARMLVDQRKIDTMVAEVLKDAESAASAIRRHPV
ncbi:hypothetical protein [Endozoicomonas sp.]|uniref:hypothetical protein n=1 Tax=Endozoicomonas sp. TaxID=1892382 RepID=UPI0028866FA2|nr:hypothetical protein [Endozoicomonas sp.]